MEPSAFLEMVFEDQVSPTDVDDLLAWANRERREGREGEGLLLDFKSALALETGDRRQEKETRWKWRRDLVAFANAAGGVLVIGIDEEDRPGWPRRALVVRGVRDSAPDALSWVTATMQPVAHALHAPPIVRTIEHPSGRLWLVAMPRSPGPLLPIASATEKWIYPIRTEDGTRDAPDYLVSDLLVGRRAQPSFEISSKTHSSVDSIRGSLQRAVSMTVEMNIENTSMVFAKDVFVNFVTLHYNVDPETDRTRPPPSPKPAFENRLVLSQSLRRQLDFAERADLVFRHRVIKLDDMEPFAAKPVILPKTIYPVPMRVAWAAIIVSHQSGAPQFFQFKFEGPKIAWEESESRPVPMSGRPRVSVE